MVDSVRRVLLQSDDSFWCRYLVCPIRNSCNSNNLYYILGFIPLDYLNRQLPVIFTWIIVKIVNLFLKDQELSIHCIYFYPLNGILRLTRVK